MLLVLLFTASWPSNAVQHTLDGGQTYVRSKPFTSVLKVTAY
jgi:hypothetical protein